MIEWDPAIGANREFQSALVRMGFWVFGVIYLGSTAYTGYYRVDRVYFFLLFGISFLLFIGMLISVLIRPEWTARQYLGLVLDITAVSSAIYLIGAINPFSFIYIWIFIYAATRYGPGHLTFAAILSLPACALTMTALDAWRTHPYESAFVLLFLVVLPIYQHTLLRRLRQARREAEAANRAKGDFLAVMSHELRTPLTGVVGMTNLLQTTPLSAEQCEYVDSIGSSAEVLQALIGDVLDLSKIEAGKLHLEAIAFDPRAAVREVCAVLKPQALAKGLNVILDLDPALPDRVIGDELRVRQILFNLIGNAIKFTDQGEVRVHGSWRPSDELVSRPHLLLEVADTGIGIPASRLEEIFEHFRQADPSTTRRYGGTGLGTTIARDLTHLMGGHIGVDSEVGKGSRFRVRLPLPRETRPMAPESEPRVETQGSTQPAAAPGLRILVAEDNAIAGKVVKTLLEKQGHEVILVGDGEQALRRIRAEPFALALVDVQLPALDGIGLTRALRASPEPRGRLPIIALTANASEEVRHQCLAAGMDDFLSKPVRPRDLGAMIERYAG